jgi:hypothetical protein
LVGPSGEFGSLEVGADGTEFYAGTYAFAEDLNLQNLRPVPGWSEGGVAPRADASARTVRCPHCAAAVELRAAGLTLSVVCGSCGTLLDPTDKDVQVVQRAEQVRQALNPALPLGLRGKFNGLPFEVVGLLQRSDGASDWDEYLLFNPWHGFLWLVTYQGHWSLVYRLLNPPESSFAKTAVYQGRRYSLFAEGESRVKAVLGEFY